MKLTKRQNQLLQCFVNDETLTSAQLGTKLSVSSRTIRNEIKIMNDMFEKPLIIINKSKGFQLDQNHPALEYLLSKESFDSDNNNVRNTQILKTILTNDNINYYDLAEQFYLSQSNLDKIIQYFNSIIQKRYPDIAIQRKNNLLVLSTDESIRRDIFSYFLVQEIRDFNFEISNYSSFFTTCNLDSLKQIVVDFDNEHHIDMRDFEIFSFVLHIAIMLERVNKGREITDMEDVVTEPKADYLAKKFYACLQDKLSITLPDKELTQLSLLFSCKISHLSMDNIRQYTEFIEQVLQSVNEIYNFDLTDNTHLKDNLLVHLLGLESRIKTNSFLTNPLIKDIKRHFPLLYDISVYITKQLQDYFHCVLLEDEIGYITLHLMNVIDHFQEKYEKKVILVSALGKSEITYMKNKLSNFDSKFTIHVVKSLTLFEASQCQNDEVDLIITTIPLSFKTKSPVYTCNKLLSDTDLKKIHQIFMSENHQDDDFKKFFDPHLFFYNLDLNTEEEVIHFMCQKLVENGYCDETFEEKVLSRESIAPTTYGNLFAIPHPIEKCAFKNGIAVAILKNTIQWQSQKTKLVLLFSLSTNKDKRFDEVFEKLVNLLDDINKVKELLKQPTLSEFLHVFSKE